jgi:hypothetical protein
MGTRRDYRGAFILLLSGLVVGRLAGDFAPHRMTAVEAQASEEQRIVAAVKAVSPAVVSVNPGHGGSGVIIRHCEACISPIARCRSRRPFSSVHSLATNCWTS